MTPDSVRVAISAGGICGSDLHYFHDGGFGPIRVREPIILGHEASGRVVEVGDRVDSLRIGDLVAINPSRPCGDCRFCNQDEFVHCLNMNFRGSAYRFPHEQGLFRDTLVLPAAQLHVFRTGVSVQEAACAEPLSVCLHAVKQAPDLSGKRVLVTGAGPIGALCASVASLRGASEIVVTDIENYPLSVARQMGATSTVNARTDRDGLDPFKVDKGQFDVVFECSAAAPAITEALEALRPRGTMVLVGVAGETPVPINLIVSKEIKLRGTHRFHEEFAKAVKLIDTGALNVQPILSRSFDYEDALLAFQTAGDRNEAIKVHILFKGEAAA
ncbi:MAG: L-idonate 5-dehydrogenase [Hyphomicrobiales bacterium]